MDRSAWAIFGAVAAGFVLSRAANMLGSTCGTGLRDNVANGQLIANKTHGTLRTKP
jgi:hypothetical protein